MLKVAIVILNWNGKEHLRNFLPSVIANTPDYAEVILADNASTDDSIAFMQQNFPQVNIIKNITNEGFAEGYNSALAKVNAEYYVLLNSDVEVAENWVEPLILAMESNLNLAACQPKVKSYLRKDYFEHAGAAGGYIDQYGYVFCRGRVFETIEKDTGQYDDECEIFWATGACMFVRAKAFHEVGGFDADFFAHMEEIDLCWRMKKRGYSIKYIPSSKVFHLGGGTLNYLSPQKTYLNFRNSLFLLLKNLPKQQLFPVIIFRMILDGVAAIKFLTQGSFKHFAAVAKAHGHFYSAFSKIYVKREQLTFSNLSGIYQKSIVWQYFIKGKKQFSQLPDNKVL
jgi:GT2 family glycosyltransferase